MCHSKRKLVPLTPVLLKSLEEKEEKTYFFDQSQLPKEYLMRIVLLPRLFANGLGSFYHLQSKSYYIALLDSLQHKTELLAALLTNQPAVYYKEQLNNPKKGGKRKHHAAAADASRNPNITVAVDSDIEQDISIHQLQRLATQHAAASTKTKRQTTRGRGRGRGNKEKTHEDESNENEQEIMLEEDDEKSPSDLDEREKSESSLLDDKHVEDNLQPSPSPTAKASSATNLLPASDSTSDSFRGKANTLTNETESWNIMFVWREL